MKWRVTNGRKTQDMYELYSDPSQSFVCIIIRQIIT